MKPDKAILYFKLSFIGAFLLLFGTFFLTYTLFEHSPALRVLSQFYTKDVRESFQQYEAVPFEAEERNLALMDEMLLRYYIEMRYETLPDTYEMVRRWRVGSPFYLLTVENVYQQFIGEDFEKKIVGIKNAVSTVDILKIEQNERDAQTYYVDFDVYIRAQDGQLTAQKKRATITIGHGRGRKTTSFENPYRMYIREFSEKIRNN